jgi:hypothetical protein
LPQNAYSPRIPELSGNECEAEQYPNTEGDPNPDQYDARTP